MSAGAIALVAIVGGCSTHAEFVHPDFARFDVQRIGLYNVDNSTVYELRAVSFGGVFQRTVFGVREYDLHSLLQGAIEEALLIKNYETLNLGPSPPASEAGTGTTSEASAPVQPAAADVGHAHDAELSCTILFWRAETGSRAEMELRFRVELYSVPEREKLYAGTFKAVMKDAPRARTQPTLDKVIRPAVIRAFGDLPTAKVGDGEGA